VKVARSLGAKHVVLVGASFGGNASIVAAANTRLPVDGVVSLSGPASFTLDAVARHLHVPVLYVAARFDEGGALASDAKALYAATASRDKRIELASGAAHGVQLVAGAGKARDLVEEFVRKVSGG